MFQTFRNAWKIPELKNRLLFTLAILVVYRLGCAIPVPFVSGSALTQMFANGDMLSYLNMMSGGALARCTLFALGVTPYINASIIVQLLTVAIPALENLAKEADGQQKLQQINRYAGAVVALIMSIGYYFVIRNMGALKYVSGAVGVFAAVVIIATFVAGAQLITWAGEQIDDKGIGNGVSLLIFASIVSNWSSLYTSVTGLMTRAAAGEPQFYILLPVLVILALVAVVFVVVMTNAERRITIQYAKRVVGRKQMGGQNSYLPLKLNMSGVMPIIFASALVSIPGTIGSFLQIEGTFFTSRAPISPVSPSANGRFRRICSGMFFAPAKRRRYSVFPSFLDEKWGSAHHQPRSSPLGVLRMGGRTRGSGSKTVLLTPL